MVDRLYQYAHFLPLKHPFMTLSVTENFIQEVVKLHGFPSMIVSDWDKILMSHFWKELFSLQGTSLHRSTSYHP